MSRKWHPDRNADNVEKAEAKFREVTQYSPLFVHPFRVAPSSDVLTPFICIRRSLQRMRCSPMARNASFMIR